MSGQSVGVTPFKGIIKWMYPRAVEVFDLCAKLHDQAYKNVQWETGLDATLKIDVELLDCMLKTAGGDEELMAQAKMFYRVARRWGQGRAMLWKVGVRY
jgi:hypothetical protein